jgi:hypothetical protein
MGLGLFIILPYLKFACDVVMANEFERNYRALKRIEEEALEQGRDR